MFPDEPTLIARGKYSTLSSERHEQIKRIQDTCRTMQGAVPLILADAQDKPPIDGSYVELVKKCIENITSARERIITLSLGMNELENEAWPK